MPSLASWHRQPHQLHNQAGLPLAPSLRRPQAPLLHLSPSPRVDSLAHGAPQEIPKAPTTLHSHLLQLPPLIYQ